MAIALVTGSSKGIGLAIVRELHKQGCQVMACARGAEDLAAVANDIGSQNLATTTADMAEVADCRRVVEETLSAFGGIDIVVNNAGVYDPGSLADLAPDSWDHTFNVNVRAPYLVAQAAYPHLAQKGSGAVINIASTNGLMSEPQFAAYNASKAALISLTETMAVEWAASGIRVNAIAPGWVRTPLSEPWVADLSSAQLQALFPAGRVGLPEEIASMAAYLSSGSCPYLTGATIRIDGGMLAKHPGL